MITTLVGISLTVFLFTWLVTFIHRLSCDNRHKNTLRNISELERQLYPDMPKDLRWETNELPLGLDAERDGVENPLLYFDRDEGYLQRPGTIIELPLSTQPVLTSFFNGAKVLGKNHPYSLEIQDEPGVYYGKIVMGA